MVAKCKSQKVIRIKLIITELPLRISQYPILISHDFQAYPRGNANLIKINVNRQIDKASLSFLNLLYVNIMFLLAIITDKEGNH